MAELKRKKSQKLAFLCATGTNIAGSIDIKAVMEYAKTLPNVAIADDY